MSKDGTGCDVSRRQQQPAAVRSVTLTVTTSLLRRNKPIRTAALPAAGIQLPEAPLLNRRTRPARAPAHTGPVHVLHPRTDPALATDVPMHPFLPPAESNCANARVIDSCCYCIVLSCPAPPPSTQVAHRSLPARDQGRDLRAPYPLLPAPCLWKAHAYPHPPPPPPHYRSALACARTGPAWRAPGGNPTQMV